MLAYAGFGLMGLATEEKGRRYLRDKMRVSTRA